MIGATPPHVLKACHIHNVNASSEIREFRDGELSGGFCGSEHRGPACLRTPPGAPTGRWSDCGRDLSGFRDAAGSIDSGSIFSKAVTFSRSGSLKPMASALSDSARPPHRKASLNALG